MAGPRTLSLTLWCRTVGWRRGELSSLETLLSGEQTEGFWDVSDRVYDILVGEGKQLEVVIHVGTNDIGKKRDEVLKCEFRELGRRLKNRTSRVAFSGLLPVLRDSESKNWRRWQLNVWLRSWCKGQDFRFLDHWDLFWGRRDMYRLDGLHLNSRGSNILAGRFASMIRDGLN